MSRRVTAAIHGASGYTGGELLRLLLRHPNVEVVGATSAKLAGDPLHRAHPNLRGATDLKFVPRNELPDADVVFSCTPHTEGMKAVPGLLREGRLVVDLSADFRLRDAAAYASWYGVPHTAPDLLSRAVYGLPETRRSQLKGASLVSGVGCFATATTLALLPLARAGLLEGARVVADGKIGSSAAGAEVTPAAMHPERSRSHRLYAPTEHRHAAEVAQETGATPHCSVHAVELVRGVLSTCHVLLPGPAPDEKTLWKAYRAQYQDEPFVRIVKERQGIHRGPDPILVAGSNLADVSFHAQPGEQGRIVATCAIDNLGKGAAGSAVQSMNVALGLPETAGLTALPLHPV
ncbi:MAG: LysW-gamma-L-alpha-aminoadipyl-6-phosphate/LysW-L-glutamyl-5-phosphate reductase [Thermoplasmata archaeon]|jgi:N-acetyl-gamma-glutamyl-phosphate/LysW-gamma-L-alpha-aminoadipyl-6-phosphate reductase|nr:LysW-gamma-L-alpha-aminoadipyl-6-phosphate/LysW-L-glutamyl-5-phosphate reductase [Thermoplasmata archaeon]